MPNKMYRRGVAYEYRVKKKLKAEGWTVLRTAGSHGVFDLIAIQAPWGGVNGRNHLSNWGLIKLIQCKTGTSAKREIRKVEQSDIKRFEGLYSVSVEVV